MTIGSAVPSETGTSVLARARERASLIPDLLIEAQRIANTVTNGWHGRRRRGNGDTFWQFRPYDQGESMTRIDWRRSARDDSVYVRDQEWEAAHTVWIWADSSPSMLFKSEAAQVSKQSRALVLALAMTEILAKSGERVGWPGITNALSSRVAAERIAAELMVATPDDDLAFPPLANIRRRSELIVISDFLEPIDTTLGRINEAAEQGIHGSLIHVVDPAEERFPYSGRTEFTDPESGNKLTFGRAETLADEYATLFKARRDALAQQCKRLGWNYIVHHSDNLASTALVALHVRLSGEALS
ncbi:MAG: DUF58 domain-containing protein [Rhizobiaceae bacterium]|nr:DUF58 domain-containing protein [Rhizobiaceae bacterium]